MTWASAFLAALSVGFFGCRGYDGLAGVCRHNDVGNVEQGGWQLETLNSLGVHETASSCQKGSIQLVKQQLMSSNRALFQWICSDPSLQHAESAVP